MITRTANCVFYVIYLGFIESHAFLKLMLKYMHIWHVYPQNNNKNRRKMDMRKTFSSISPKTAFYLSNGSGRDSYIACNNGGMTIAKGANLTLDHGIERSSPLGGFPQHKGYYGKSPSIDSKYLFYHSDGTGRDSYVA